MRALATGFALALVVASCTSSEVTDDVSSTAEPVSELSCWRSEPGAGDGELTLVDVTADVGLVDPLSGMHGHAAIWTDVDGDQLPDLMVGTYADRPSEIYAHRGAQGPSPDRLLVQGDEGFVEAALEPRVRSRSSGGISADLDGDGDLDLVISRNIKDASLGQTPSQIYENDDGELRPALNPFPAELGGRSVGAFDYDLDGDLDLFVVEDRWTGGNSVLLRNDGELSFSIDEGSGLPDDIHGLGVATADLTGDGIADLFVAGSNRLFLGTSDGEFVEEVTEAFAWEVNGPEDDVAGISVADVNRDGLLDIALGHHYNSTLEDGAMVSVRLYLNQGSGSFEDVTEEAGLIPLPTKAPHVELSDMDNDGWPDLLTSASAAGFPATFIHQGLVDGVPRFETPEGLGAAQYWVAAPTADYDRDGRLDVFLLEWEPSLPSLLLRNETVGGNWLEVSIGASAHPASGWKVTIHADGELLGAREITVTQGYSAGVLPIAHFGLGAVPEVDVMLTPPGGGDPIRLEAIDANQHIRWPAGC